MIQQRTRDPGFWRRGGFLTGSIIRLMSRPAFPLGRRTVQLRRFILGFCLCGVLVGGGYRKTTS